MNRFTVQLKQPERFSLVANPPKNFTLNLVQKQGPSGPTGPTGQKGDKGDKGDTLDEEGIQTIVSSLNLDGGNF